MPIGAPKNLAIVSGALYSVYNYLIERHISALGNIHVASDEPGVAGNIARRIGKAVTPVPDFDPGTYDRDIAYALSADLYKQFERRADQRDRSVRLVDLDLSTEKFKLSYLDNLTQVFAESVHYHDSVIAASWGKVHSYVDPEATDFPLHLSTFRKLAKRPEMYSVINGAVTKMNVYHTRLFCRPPQTLSSKIHREGLDAVRDQKMASASAALSKHVVVIGGKTFRFPTFGSKAMPVRSGRDVMLSAAKEDLGLFQHVTTLLCNSADLPPSVLLIAETQSRPYAEALAIAMRYIPNDLNLIVLAPNKAAAVSRFFSDAIFKTANDRLGRDASETVLRELKAAKEARRGPVSENETVGSGVEETPAIGPYSEEMIALIHHAFPNVQFQYVDIRETDRAFVNAEWIKQNRASEVAFVEETIELQLNEVPVEIPRLRHKAIVNARQAYHDTIAFDLLAKELLNQLDGKITSLVTYSGRTTLSRIAAIEAKRRGIMVVDWQCTILGKTPVFPTIIADRVLAIFKNAAELYESYFGFRQSRIDIVGFPRFMRRMTQWDRVASDEILLRHGIHARSRLHIFASQPLALRMQESFLKGLAEASVLTESTILVCAHPSQRLNGQAQHLKSFVSELNTPTLVYSDEFEASDLFVFAKSVIAYSSTFLFEAAHFGWPAILFDPLDEPHILDYEDATEIMHAKTSASLADCLRRAEYQNEDRLSRIDFAEEEKRCAELVWRGITRPLD